MNSFEALNELRRVAGSQLDPVYVEALADLLVGPRHRLPPRRRGRLRPRARHRAAHERGGRADVVTGVSRRARGRSESEERVELLDAEAALAAGRAVALRWPASDQRRTVEIDTPRWRAASDAVRPRRDPGSVVRLMVRKYDTARGPRSEPACSFAQVWRAEPAAGRMKPMGRLDDVDLSLKLSRKEQDRLLALHGARLAQLRLTLGGLIGAGSSGRRCACSSRAGTPAARAAPSSAWSRRSTPATSASVRSPRRRPTRSATTTCTASSPQLPGWGGMAVLDRTWYGRVLVERVEGFATEEQWRRAYARDRRLRAHARRRRHDHRQVLPAHLRRRAAQALRAPREQDPLKAWKLTDEDWRNREQAPRLRGRARGDVRAHRHRARAVADRPGRVQALRARARDGGGHRRHRGRLRAQRASRCPRRSSRSTD